MGGRDQSVQYGRRAHVSERASEQPLRNPLNPRSPSLSLPSSLRIPASSLPAEPPLRQRTASLWILMAATPIRPAYVAWAAGFFPTKTALPTAPPPTACHAEPRGVGRDEDGCMPRHVGFSIRGYRPSLPSHGNHPWVLQIKVYNCICI